MTRQPREPIGLHRKILPEFEANFGVPQTLRPLKVALPRHSINKGLDSYQSHFEVMIFEFSDTIAIF